MVCLLIFNSIMYLLGAWMYHTTKDPMIFILLTLPYSMGILGWARNWVRENDDWLSERSHWLFLGKISFWLAAVVSFGLLISTPAEGGGIILKIAFLISVFAVHIFATIAMIEVCYRLYCSTYGSFRAVRDAVATSAFSRTFYAFVLVGTGIFLMYSLIWNRPW